MHQEFSITVNCINNKHPDEFIELHRRDYFEILLFKIGQGGCQIIDFKEYDISNHSAFIITPGQLRLLKKHPEENGIFIQFTKSFLELSIAPSLLDWFFRLQTNHKINLTLSQFEKLYSYFEKLKELYESSGNFQFQKLQKWFGLVFFEFLDCVPDKPKLYKKQDLPYEFMWLAHGNFREIRLVKGYAQLLDTNINKLEIEVKKHFGKSPSSIINELLIIEIKRLFLLGKLSHKEIAFGLNFDSPSSYSRFIKTQTEMTPTELKKRIRGKIT